MSSCFGFEVDSTIKSSILGVGSVLKTLLGSSYLAMSNMAAMKSQDWRKAASSFLLVPSRHVCRGIDSTSQPFRLGKSAKPSPSYSRCGYSCTRYGTSIGVKGSTTSGKLSMFEDY